MQCQPLRRRSQSDSKPLRVKQLTTPDRLVPGFPPGLSRVIAKQLRQKIWPGDRCRACSDTAKSDRPWTCFLFGFCLRS